MKLMTKAIIKNLPPTYKTDSKPLAQKKVIIKFFTPWTNYTWFVFEGDPVKDENGNLTGDWEFFGMVHGQEQELGYFNLSQLTEINGPFGLKVERDRSVNGDLYGTGKL